MGMPRRSKRVVRQRRYKRCNTIIANDRYESYIAIKRRLLITDLITAVAEIETVWPSAITMLYDVAVSATPDNGVRWLYQAIRTRLAFFGLREVR